MGRAYSQDAAQAVTGLCRAPGASARSGDGRAHGALSATENGQVSAKVRNSFLLTLKLLQVPSFEPQYAGIRARDGQSTLFMQ